jgi:hypothetical protein
MSAHPRQSVTSVYTPSPYARAPLPLPFPPLLFLPELTCVRLPWNSGSFDLRQPNEQVGSTLGLPLRPRFGSYLEILGTELCNIFCMKVFICDLLLFHFHIIVILCCCLIWLFLFWFLSPRCILYPIRIPPLFCVSPTHDVSIFTQVYALRSNQEKIPGVCRFSLIVNVRVFYNMRERLKMGFEVGRPHRLTSTGEFKLSILYTQNSRKKSLLVDFLLSFRCYYAPYRNIRGFKSDYIVSCVGI